MSVYDHDPIVAWRHTPAYPQRALDAGAFSAAGVMALGNVVMFALVQKAQQETVELAARIASNGGDGALLDGGEGASGGQANSGRSRPRQR